MLGTEPQIIENYVKTGKVKIVFWHMLDFGVSSLAASEAAECAGEQGAFWPMHDVLYEQQSRMWRDPRKTAVELAQSVPGIDVAAFQRCMNESRYAGKVQTDNKARTEKSVRVRPTLDINGRRVEGALSYSQLSKILDEALAIR